MKGAALGSDCGFGRGCLGPGQGGTKRAVGCPSSVRVCWRCLWVGQLGLALSIPWASLCTRMCACVTKTSWAYLQTSEVHLVPTAASASLHQTRSAQMFGWVPGSVHPPAGGWRRLSAAHWPGEAVGASRARSWWEQGRREEQLCWRRVTQFSCKTFWSLCVCVCRGMTRPIEGSAWSCQESSGSHPSDLG